MLMDATNSGQRHSGARSAFTLVEILIVVVILGILATIAIPRFSSASQQTRENTLKDELRYLRTQIAVYRAQHRDASPGYSAGAASGAATEANFVAQLTMYTDEAGTTNASGSATYKYGPYLSRAPTNPINNLSTIMIVADGAAVPAPDGSTGFIYQPQTQVIIPNLTGNDSNGEAYSGY